MGRPSRRRWTAEEKREIVEETRAIGLLAAVELDAETLERNPALVERVVALARQHGLVTRSLRGCAIHISPPFVIAPRQIEAMVDRLRSTLDDARREEVGSRLGT